MLRFTSEIDFLSPSSVAFLILYSMQDVIQSNRILHPLDTFAIYAEGYCKIWAWLKKMVMVKTFKSINEFIGKIEEKMENISLPKKNNLIEAHLILFLKAFL